ncbi:conserved membrane hypothetical protein [Mesorhizobium prunaredense]|uniref:EamA domain-containing protein n=1 Tax=Mesorhizobium prunaredense TaxID=1631249 RepID=A0A1R3V4G4_9HYPH|nr:DMT family transporter [Mesorhizobium prunaredense]SIT54719.1 conserved membrane hypothetical protein [Mesorhizobium prunaredense]
MGRPPDRERSATARSAWWRRLAPQALSSASTALLRDNYIRAILFLIVSAVATSTAGMFVRALPISTWTILFWRSVFAAAFLAVYLLATGHRAGFRPTMQGMAIAICLAVNMLAFIPACQFTSTANAFIIFSAGPVLTGILAWLWLSEDLRPATIVAAITILIGTYVLVAGAGSKSELFGNAFAIVTTVTMSITTVLIRRHREESVLSFICLANAFVALVSFWFCEPFFPNLRDLGLLALFGFVQLAFPAVFFLAGTRRLPACQVSLILALEAPLAPLWTWLAFREMPTRSDLIGGSIITVAVVGYLVVMARSIRSEREGAAS